MSDERQPQILDLEKIVRSKAGKKAKYIPGFVIRWFERFVHLDFINEYLKEGYMGVDFCENCVKYLGVELEVKGLENLPKDIKKYQNLITLRFYENKIKIVPELPQSLQTIDAYDNEIEYFESENLPNLRVLNIIRNKLKKYPQFASNATECLFFRNQISVVPEGSMNKNENIFNFMSNDLQEIPKELMTFKTLEQLYFGNNNIKELPEELKALNLVNLSLSHNPIGMIKNIPNTLRSLSFA